MKFKTFGSGDKVSAIGLGCMGMSHAYGKLDEKSSINTLEYALDLGLNFWDTADFYGNGKNEELISKVLKHNREKVFICTKFGIKYIDEQSFGMQIDGSVEWMKEAVEASLSRLQIECIDLYYLHRVDTSIPIEETINGMASLVKEGKVRYIGLSEASLETIKKAHKIHPISALQSEYSLLTRGVEKEILPFLKENNIMLVPYSPLGRGMFNENFNINDLSEDDMRLNLPRFQGEHLINNQNLIKELGDFAKTKNATVPMLALAWLLQKSDNIIPIPGTRHKKYLESNVKSLDISLSSEDIVYIESIIAKYPNTGKRYPEAALNLTNR